MTFAEFTARAEALSPNDWVSASVTSMRNVYQGEQQPRRLEFVISVVPDNQEYKRWSGPTPQKVLDAMRDALFPTPPTPNGELVDSLGEIDPPIASITSA